MDYCLPRPNPFISLLAFSADRGVSQRATAAIVAEGQKVWQQLNARVDIDKLEPDEVAREYLLKHGLVK